MKRTLAAALGASLLLVAPPAAAQDLAVGDAMGDTGITTLDIISVTVHNQDRAVVVDVEVEDATRDGNLVVSLDPRGGTGVRVVSKFRATGGTKNFVLRKAFTDKGSSTKRVRCKVRLGDATSPALNPVIILRMPSRCLAGGNFGALRFAATSQLGGDRDVAPQKASGKVGVSDWVARG